MLSGPGFGLGFGPGVRGSGVSGIGPGSGFDLPGLGSGVRLPGSRSCRRSPFTGAVRCCFLQPRTAPVKGQKADLCCARAPHAAHGCDHGGGPATRVRVSQGACRGNSPGTLLGYLLTVLVLTLNHSQGNGLGIISGSDFLCEMT